MMVEILTGCLNGANCGYEAAPFMADDHLPPDLGQTFMAIDPEKCSGSFLAKVGSLAGVISSQDGARIPGERPVSSKGAETSGKVFSSPMISSASW